MKRGKIMLQDRVKILSDEIISRAQELAGILGPIAAAIDLAVSGNGVPAAEPKVSAGIPAGKKSRSFERIPARPGPKARKTETEKSLSAPGTKPCRKCGAVKKLKEFTTNHACRDGHTNECKECARERQKRAWRAKHGKSAGSGELAFECRACHARFQTELARSNHNCVRAARAAEF